MYKKYSLYLASGITLWKEYFSKKYSEYFNKKIALFEPGVLDNPDDHRKIPIWVACFDLDKINHADALLVYMKGYKTLDGSPSGTDSTWECGYAIAHGKPVIMLIENKEHIDYYASQWMVSFSINAILTADREVAEIVKAHPKFVHTTVLLADSLNQFESKIKEYLDDYYRSIYSRSGITNYYVDARARELFDSKNLEKLVFIDSKSDKEISSLIDQIKDLNFESDGDSLKVCGVEREISKYLKGQLTELKINEAIFTAIEKWGQPRKHILNCLVHSIKPPFEKVEEHKQGIKKTRPELFFELYDLVTHHLTPEQRFIKSDMFPYEVGALVELYNWMNTYALDDVFDNSAHRQKLETVWKAFSRRDAIFTGILGHLLTLKFGFIIAETNQEVAKEIARIMNDYNEQMYEGQVFDIDLTFNNDDKKNLLRSGDFKRVLDLYIKRIYGICGAFYEAIGELAAKVGNKKEQIMNYKEIDEISPLAGMYYGIIQMIRNDLGDYIFPEDFSGMSRGMKGISHSDIIEGKTDLAYLEALYSENLTKTEKTFLIEKLHSDLSSQDKLEINRLLWKSGAIELTVDVILHIIKHVKKNILPRYHETPTRMKWMFDLVEITKEILIPFQGQAHVNRWEKYEYGHETSRQIADNIIELEKIRKQID